MRDHCGIRCFATGQLCEAMELRHAGITMPILILGHTPKEQVGKLMENRITQEESKLPLRIGPIPLPRLLADGEVGEDALGLQTLYGHGAAGALALWLRRVCRRAGLEAGDDPQDHRQHHQDVSKCGPSQR